MFFPALSRAPDRSADLQGYAHSLALSLQEMPTGNFFHSGICSVWRRSVYFLLLRAARESQGVFGGEVFPMMASLVEPEGDISRGKGHG